MLIDKTDALWPLVSAAFQAVQGPVPAGLTGDQFAQNCILIFIQNVVSQSAAQGLQPTTAAVQTAQATAIEPIAAQMTSPAKVVGP
jgi:hypothetical protein